MINVMVAEYNELNRQMLADLSDDDMDSLVARASAIEDRILAASCTTMDDFLAKRAIAIEWTSIPGSIHRHEAAVLARLACDLLDVRRREMVALIA
jgi:hypothetical protein